MVDFRMPKMVENVKNMIHQFAESSMRPVGRHYDEHEHTFPDELNLMVQQMTNSMSGQMGGGMMGPGASEGKKEKKAKPEGEKKPKEPSFINLMTAVATEELTWGDAGLMLNFPSIGLGGAAIMAVGTPEQKQKFLGPFMGTEPKWGAMAITEPGCGSDASAITTSAVLDGKEWVLNGEKIFVTSGSRADFVVVWATVDKSAGRAGIKSFVVEKGAPGMTVTKIENKLGIRCSDTASIVFEDCRIPKENILGSPEVVTKGEGFKGVMQTFDNTRPIVAAMAIGIARAALEFTKETLEKEGVKVRYGYSDNLISTVERDILEMEANLDAARLLTWRAVCMLDGGQRNSLEASMAKAKAGKAATLITQKCVELLGPLGYSRDLLVEKWMRDSKINDIYEGTGQIQLLVVARQLLGFSKKELK